MKNQKITINNIEFVTEDIIKLLENNSELLAVKLIIDKTKIGLKEAKDIIDDIKNGKYKNSSHPIISINKDIKGNKNQITEKHKRISTKKRKENSLFITKNEKDYKTYIIIICIFFLTLYYFYSNSI